MGYHPAQLPGQLLLPKVSALFLRLSYLKPKRRIFSPLYPFLEKLIFLLLPLPKRFLVRFLARPENSII